MIRHLGSSLTDVTYVFDEPTIGLHPHDVERMNDLLLQLRDKGNTVLVVEHEPETIAIADHVVDIGPGAGTSGGTSPSKAPSTGCGRARRSPAVISTTGRRSRSPCGRPRARWRSAAPRPTICRRSMSTSRSACWSSSPASPAPARARSSRDRSQHRRESCRSTRRLSAVREGATRRRTPDSSSRSARRSRRRTT